MIELILVTGDREWTDRATIRRALNPYPRTATIMHGDARGADKRAAHEALRLGWPVDKIEAVPAEWSKFGRSAGPIRNRVMLDRGPDVVLAFHRDLCGRSKGTKDCVQEALKREIPVYLYPPGARLEEAPC